MKIELELRGLLERAATEFIDRKRPKDKITSTEGEDISDQIAAKMLIKHWDYAASFVRNRIASRYGVKYDFRASDRFQPKWIVEDDGIMRNLNKYPFFAPFLDYLFDLTNRPNNKNFTKIQELTGGEMYLKTVETGPDKGKKVEHAYAAFETGRAFYEDVEKNVIIPSGGKTVSLGYENAKKYLKAYARANIIKELGKARTNGKIYSDGWYLVDRMGKRIKHKFLKATPDFKKALREFRT